MGKEKRDETGGGHESCILKGYKKKGGKKNSSSSTGRETSKTLEGRTATVRVQSLFVFSFFFLFLYSGARNLFFVASIAALFLVTFSSKKKFIF